MSPSSCIRCSRPLPAGSTSGLCAVCLSNGDTSHHLLQTPVSAGPPTERETASVEPIKFPDVLDDTTVSGPEAPITVAPLPGTESDPGHTHPVGQPLPPPGYDLLRRLGGGGMGDVFLAREHTSERSVAIKFLRSPGNPTAVERFLAEVRALARLDNPHIVKVFATDFYRHQPFFTMEYAPRGTLLEQVNREGPFDPIRAARLIATVARAVQVAHAAHILHRDLKPNNILLGENGEPRVSDFGLAKLTDRDDGITNPTGALGTPSYMPPEQVSRRHGEIGPQADVYGLGATLYHLLTGGPPFVGETPAEITVRVERDLPERPRALRADIPVDLEAIVMKCLEKKADDRYPSPGALADDLDRFLAGKTPVAPPLTRLRRLRRWVGRQRTLVAAVAMLAVATAFMLSGGWQRLFGPRDEAERIRNELRAGRSVKLIGESGPPRWHRWPIGAAALGDSFTGDGACSFDANYLSLLELLDDPGIDRYQVTADIQLLYTKIVPDAAGRMQLQGSAATLVGLYFGRSSPQAGDGIPAHFMFAATYNDHILAASRSQGNAVMLRTSLIVPRPEAPPLDQTATVEKSEIRFAGRDLPGDWRRLRVEIRPEGCKVFWAQRPGGPEELLADLSAADINELYRSMAETLDAKHPGLGVPTPAWNPRTPFGIWSRGTAVAFRNVVVEPLPRPE